MKSYYRFPKVIKSPNADAITAYELWREKVRLISVNKMDSVRPLSDEGREAVRGENTGAERGTERDPPKGKDVRLFGERKLVFCGLGGELTDELRSEMTQPAAWDPQLILSPTGERRR